MSRQGRLFIVSAPSGGGKTSLVAALVQTLPRCAISISHTTRFPRLGETEGKNYFFVDEATFVAYQQQDIFLESAQVFNHWYGTSKSSVIENLQKGVDVFLDIDWQGARAIKAQMPCTSIFILPPSQRVLEARLKGRRQDSESVISARMAKAQEEISHYAEYDFIIINNEFDEALADLSVIVKAQRLSKDSQEAEYAQLIASLLVT